MELPKEGSLHASDVAILFERGNRTVRVRHWSEPDLWLEILKSEKSIIPATMSRGVILYLSDDKGGTVPYTYPEDVDLDYKLGGIKGQDKGAIWSAILKK